MSDLSKMIDDTTERLLKKVDDMEIPQSDEMEILKTENKWYSEQLHEASEKCERLQKQLDIAVKGIKAVLDDEFFCETADGGLIMYLYTALERIEELNK